MTTASTVPAVIDALDDQYTAWLADAGFAKVEVHQADPDNPPKEYVQLGEVLGRQEWVTQAPFRQEEFSAVCWLFVAADPGLLTAREVKDRAFAIHAVLAAGVRELPGLGIHTDYQLLEAQHGDFRAHPAPSEWGYGYWIRFEVDVEAIF